MSAKKVWKICSSNARATIKKNGVTPSRCYPYCGTINNDWQKYLNSFARFVYEFHGGVWSESE